MNNNEKALARLYTMSDWQEFPGFNAHQILEELYKLQGSLWLEEYNEEYNYIFVK